MQDLINKLSHSPLGPLEGVCSAIGQELGMFLNRSIDKIFGALEKKEEEL